MTNHDEHIRRILEEIEAGTLVSHRRMSQMLGLSLGLTNKLLRTLITRRCIRVKPGPGKRRTYLLTPRGVQEKAAVSRRCLSHALTVYSSAREQIRRRLAELRATSDDGCNGDSGNRVVLYGSGEVTEIALTCVQAAGLQVVGVVGLDDPSRFPGVTVYSPRRLSATGLDGYAFDWVVVTSLGDREEITRELVSVGISPQRVYWL